MWFEQIVREETGCAAYMIGSEAAGECVVVDPLWDIAPYLRISEKRGAAIRFAIDSHSHADHVSGARRIARATGAELLLPERADVAYGARRLRDRERIELGEVALEIVHTPGHRPELICILVTDRSRGNEPWCILTADFLLVGDIARPDLAMPSKEGAGLLFDVSLPRLFALSDYVEVYPGHVAGST
jgi:glyoxylase-like metal-dependent hydrolase (beta-lactamase superfamily II)